MCEPPTKPPRIESNIRSVGDDVLQLKKWIRQILSETLHPDLNFFERRGAKIHMESL